MKLVRTWANCRTSWWEGPLFVLTAENAKECEQKTRNMTAFFLRLLRGFVCAFSLKNQGTPLALTHQLSLTRWLILMHQKDEIRYSYCALRWPQRFLYIKLFPLIFADWMSADFRRSTCVISVHFSLQFLREMHFFRVHVDWHVPSRRSQ